MFKIFIIAFFIVIAKCHGNSIFFTRDSFTPDNSELNNVGDKCSLNGGKKGTCKEVRNCESADELFKAKKFLEIIFCGFNGKMKLVCCPQSEKFEKALCKGKMETKIDIQDKIMNGKKAAIGEFPFQVALGYINNMETNPPLDFLCGGSLIADDVVLTAAHCFIRKDITAKIIRLGRTSINLTDSDDDSTHEDIEIQEIKLHPDYDVKSKINDIALVMLKRPANLNIPTIKPVCLSTNDENVPKNLTITGFGRNDRDDTTLRSEWLLKGTVENFPHEECKKKFESHRRNINSGQYCANSYEGVDACQGDSGGPLSFEKSSRFYLYGVISYGLGCGSEFPAVYTKVNQYLEWIEKEMTDVENKKYN